MEPSASASDPTFAVAAELAAAEAAFRRDHPEYAGTGVLDRLRGGEYARLDRDGHVYLDYTGAGMFADSQLRDHVPRRR